MHHEHGCDCILKGVECRAVICWQCNAEHVLIDLTLWHHLLFSLKVHRMRAVLLNRQSHLDSKEAAPTQHKHDRASYIARVVKSLAAICGRCDAERVLLPKQAPDR